MPKVESRHTERPTSFQTRNNAAKANAETRATMTTTITFRRMPASMTSVCGDAVGRGWSGIGPTSSVT